MGRRRRGERGSVVHASTDRLFWETTERGDFYCLFREWPTGWRMNPFFELGWRAARNRNVEGTKDASPEVLLPPSLRTNEQGRAGGRGDI